MEAAAASGTTRTRWLSPKLVGGSILVAIVLGSAVGFLVYLVSNAANQQTQANALGKAASAAPSPALSPDIPRDGLYGQTVWPAGALRAPAVSGLVDQTGHRFSLSQLSGKTIAMTFLSNNCGQGCAQTTKALVAAERAVPAAQRPAVVVVSVTSGGTPSQAAAAVNSTGLAKLGKVYWLTGSPSALGAVWSAYRIQVGSSAGGGTGATRAVFMIDRHGYQRAGFVFPFTSKYMAADMRALAQEKG